MAEAGGQQLFEFDQLNRHRIYVLDRRQLKRVRGDVHNTVYLGSSGASFAE